MRPLRIVVWAGAWLVVAAAAGPAPAAWNNVFQVCCAGCKSAPPVTSGYYAAYPPYSAYMAAYPADTGCAPACPQPCPQPCPQQVCETRYVQRTYYAPEVHYETRTAYDPVTTYSKSYYWEPVTSYRVSCFYDSCSCSYKQVATPTTSYRLREQCCPVQSWVARCYSVPVTTMKPYTRCEPVTSCYWTTAGAAVAPPPAGAGVNDGRLAPAPGGAGVNDSGSDGVRESNKPYKPEGFRQYAPPGGTPKTDVPTAPIRPDTFVQGPPALRLEKIIPIAPANVEGEVVRSDNTPDAGAT